MASDDQHFSDRAVLGLTVGAGATLLWLLSFVSFLRPLADGEALEWAVYLLGGSLAPVLGVAYALAAARRGSLESAALLAVFLSLAGLVFARMGGGSALVNVLLSTGALVVLASSPAGRLPVPGRVARLAGALFVAALLLIFAPARATFRFDWAVLLIASLLVAVCLGLADRVAFPSFDTVAVALIGLLVVSLRVPIEAVSSDFFLAPANEILHGKTLLVETFGQYGILPLYLIGWWGRVFRPSYLSLGLLVSLVSFLQFAVFYLLLKRLAGRRTVALGLTLLIIGLSVWTTDYASHSHPSVGALRFFVPYLVLTAELVRPGRRNPIRAAVMGVASVWSAETFVYTTAALGGIVLFEALRGRRLALFVKPMGWAAGGIAVAHTILALATRAGSGHWPQWEIYAEFLRAYTTGEVGALPVATWTPWALLAAVYLGGTVGAGVMLRRDRPALDTVEWRLVSGLAALGIVTFSYFIGRSHPFALRHICAPALMILAFWLRDGRARRPAFALAALVAVPLAWNSAQGLVKNLPLTTIGSLATGSLLADLGALSDPPAHNPESGEAAALIVKHAPSAKHVPVLVNDSAYTETMMMAGKGNFLLVDNPLQDALVWQEVPTDARFRRLPAAGSWAFVDRPERLLALQLDYLRLLEDAFCLVPGDSTSTGIRAVRLLSKTTGCPA
ncbi:MAG: hypothetical protein ACT4OM_07695 [Actinomycetota bacterium]